MKVYFISSPRNVDKEKEIFKKIYTVIEDLGHKHVTDFVLTVETEKFYISDIGKFYERTVKDLKEADVCVFETTEPSLAVGHLISMAMQHGKPVIALYREKNVPFFLSGIQDDKIQIVKYEEENLKQALRDALEYAQDQADTRFNFFISPSLSHYLDWVASTKKIPRSVYLRQLIEDDREKNREDYDAS